jgi:selenocysteine lyase/cysteine desulfurase/tRNA(Ile)-lysidine synthase TilS/MesJ
MPQMAINTTPCPHKKLMNETMTSDRSAANVPVPVEALECGASLAELEHGNDERPEGVSQKSARSLSNLRESLAADVLTGGKRFATFESPFEVPAAIKSNQKFFSVPLVYCDQTASNRPVQSIEDYMQQTCLPLYGNTHTNTSVTGSQSTAFVAEARQIVAEGTNAKITGKASLDTVLFAGNGTTSAVELLIDCLGLKYAPTESKPVVFIGPYEHHSNLVPWREAGCEIVMVPERNHKVDLQRLADLLQKKEYGGRLKMGTFSAASNVTGKVSDVDAIAATLHRHGALAFFDYATGAPYLPINMNPHPSEQYPSPSLVAKDAIFLSPHKMLGGVGTPGVLILKKALVNQVNAPSRSGGGTVFYVTNTHHRFLSNRIERYEGGTPNVAGIMRCGLTFLLKRKTEERYLLATQNEEIPPTLMDYEFATYRKVARILSERAPNLVLLGDGSSRHLPIFPFLIRCGRRFLHYNYVCAVLNDVFGIQSRGGCQCSGPYSQRVLGLTEMTEEGNEVPNAVNEKVEHALVHYKERAELLRPGYTRLSLPFKGLREEETEYVLKALEWVSNHGWALMCQYRCNHRTGEWRHASRQGKPLGSERKWLSHYDILRSEKKENSSDHRTFSEVLTQTMSNATAVLEEARRDQRSIAQALKMTEASESLGQDDAILEELRWFVYPKECSTWLIQGLEIPPETESQDVLGALRPVAVSLDELDQLDVEVMKIELTKVTLQQSDPRKRKADAAIVESQRQQVAKVVEGTEPELPVMFNFQDGEHGGAATLEDIDGGFEDGEVSENCVVFDPSTDTWLPIDEFLRSQKALPESTDVPTSGEDLSNVEMKDVTVQEIHSFGEVTDDRNQKKKPPRDSSAWGQSNTFNPVSITADVGIEEEKKESSEDVHLDQKMDISSPSPNLAVPKKQKGKGVKPPPKMMRYITQALIQWNMIEEGDRLLLGLSGGKDSMALLHCLLEFQKKLPVNFTIEVCTIDPMTPSFDPSPLIPYVESLGLKYHYIRDDIVARANSSGKDGKTVSSLCAFCARMKRGNLYSCARKSDCNKLVLAQHLDDCAESFLMSVMHNGFLRTMKANYKINVGDMSVIRPMVYCRESLMTEFAKSANLPVINENCPACFEEPKERARIKKLLSREETLFPNFYDNIRRSLIPLMHEDATGILRCYTEEAVSKSRKENRKKVYPYRPNKDLNEREEGNAHGMENVDEEAAGCTGGHDEKRPRMSFTEVSDDDLLMELARRKADKFRLSGSMQKFGAGDDVDDGMPPDPTGQVCSLNGGPGSIPCRELME